MSAETNTTSPTTGQERPAPKPIPISVQPRVLEALKRFEREYVVYRRELPRLLAEKEAGRYVLIKGDDFLTIWDTSGDAFQAGYMRFGPDEPFLVQKISPRDPELFALLDAWKEAQCR